MHYYNEFHPAAAEWLRKLMAAGMIPQGEVDERSIVEVQPDDLVGFRTCHFFAGIGGWAYAARLAGWPDDKPIWTGSPPCQPFSVAGKQRGADDERHLWPHLFRLIRARRPARFVGEQVAAAVGKHWLDGVFDDLEGIGYSGRAFVVPACAVNAPHRRDRLWFVAYRDDIGSNRSSTLANETRRSIVALDGCATVDHTERTGLEGYAGNGDAARRRAQQGGPVAEAGCGGDVGHPNGISSGQGHSHAGRSSNRSGEGEVTGLERSSDGNVADADAAERRADVAGRHDAGGPRAGWTEVAGDAEQRSAWDRAAWIICHDGKARRVEPSIPLLVDGLPERMDGTRASRQEAIKGFGNAIVPQVAAEILIAMMEDGV